MDKNFNRRLGFSASMGALIGVTGAYIDTSPNSIWAMSLFAFSIGGLLAALSYVLLPRVIPSAVVHVQPTEAMIAAASKAFNEHVQQFPMPRDSFGGAIGNLFSCPTEEAIEIALRAALLLESVDG